ncbi:MAG TPA: alpha-2-macroglobulin family protein [Thermoanaerobaculia bacterium]|nr:alpha-2-macroglobulin family protein [Thermoanaerobaculia bacterium]
MRKIAVLALLALLILSLAAAQPQASTPYTKLKTDAEREYAEKSFRRAHELYEQAAKLELPANERRWVTFRLADTELRAQLAGRTRDEKAVSAAREALQELIDKSEHDEVWAMANESLAVFTREPRYFTAALDFWAGSSDLPRARQRWLEIFWSWVGPGNETWNVPRQVLVDALQVAEKPAERARVRYILAQSYLNSGQPADRERALELLEEIVAIGRGTELYDEALFMLAANSGDDYKRALELYRRLLRELAPGQSGYRDDAESAIDEILRSAVSVFATGTFLPESEQEIHLGWRNVKQIELTVQSVDLTKHARGGVSRNWMQDLPVEGQPVVRRWTYQTNDTGEHIPGNIVHHIEPRLPVGAYVLTARSGKATARQFLLITDAHILVHAGHGRTDVYVSDVETGEPIADARVHVTQQLGREQYAELEAQTNADGLARIQHDPRGGSALITAAAGARQAFHQTYMHYWGGRDHGPSWRIYAFTDRPAYRPGETVQWKMTARIRQNEEWVTPANAELDYVITNPRGEKMIQGAARLNAFGSFWGQVPLTEAMPLGVYHITFHAKGNERDVRGGAQLFRLEEYKLPEFLVKVGTPEGKQYRLGDTIEATIDASYYFGGPVANATVEAVVFQQPFYRYWYPWRRYHWYYDPMPAPQGGTIVQRQTLTTDAEGRAVLRIDTPRDGNDSTYRIEARVVDASRREVRGEGTVRVLRQRYSVMAQPEHRVYRPGESVSVEFKALDANDKPVQATGTVTVVRRTNVARASARRGLKPAPHVDEEVLTAKVATDAEGKATFTFVPRTTGYYTILWRSEDGPRARDVVITETAVWVTERNTTELGYHAGGLDLIVDRETVQRGETASVLVVTPSSGRWVVFSSGGDDILDTQVLRMDGTVKLVQIPVEQKHMPNFFVTASSVFDRIFMSDTERIVVPPAEQFLNVEVKPDREQYEPRQEGTVTITTRDASGKPVSAEVALAVSDEAVTAIQEDLAGDPRRFFYGDTRGNPISVSAGVHSQQYVKLEEPTAEEKEEAERQLRDQSMAKTRNEASYAYDGVVGGVAGGRMGAPPPPPPAAPAPVAPPVAEAITVTAATAAGASVEQQQGIDVQVRSDFRSTAFWKPDVVTDANGTATVQLHYPEALTTWRATARAATAGAQFGMASSTARTSMPLLVRLQGPRFFVAGDRVTVSAVINNNTDQPQTVNASLEAKGLGGTHAAIPVQVPAHGEARADWTVLAEIPGPAKLTVTARNAQYGDAMERSFTVYEHGIDKLIARSGKLRGDEAVVRLDLPRERRATDLVVQVAPSIAVTMLDALPYLIEFPYGCTEQTMSRFLPAAIVARTIEKLGLGRARIAGKDLDAVTAAGIARLYDMQHGSGAWGWWKEGNDDAFMTAYVVWGFAIARDGGLSIDARRVDRAASWLDNQLVRYERAYDDQAWMLHALSAWRKTPGENARRAFENVYKNRERLSPYSRALLALTAHRWNEAERARLLLRNLEDGVQVDKTPDSSVLLKGETTAETMQTAHWGASNRFWWRWYEGPVETTAFALQAFVTIDPENKLVEPIMNWLVKNRRGTRWHNTRDTAIALLAMNEYLERSGELLGDVSYEVAVNDKVIATKTLTAQDVLGAPSRFSVDPALLADARQEVRIRRTSGKAPLYFAAEARFVSLEEPVKAAGNELFVRRQYFRLAPRPTLLKGVQYDRVPLKDNESIASGERVEVVVTVETKNDYDYLMFEDLKPGGFEAVELQSGGITATSTTGRSAWGHQELRDRKVAMFIDHLSQGIWEMRYTLRAEVPGSFHALPLLGQAMYVPDVRANGEEVRVVVTER